MDNSLYCYLYVKLFPIFKTSKCTNIFSSYSIRNRKVVFKYFCIFRLAFIPTVVSFATDSIISIFRTLNCNRTNPPPPLLRHTLREQPPLLTIKFPPVKTHQRHSPRINPFPRKIPSTEKHIKQKKDTIKLYTLRQKSS